MRRDTAAGRERKREAQSINRHVGRQVRQCRLRIGASQERLAAHLGVSFQQVQKYENGVNRISAGRLMQIADFLGVRVEDFFEGVTLRGRLTDDTATGR